MVIFHILYKERSGYNITLKWGAWWFLTQTSYSFHYLAASGAYDWAEQNDDMAENGEDIKVDIPEMKTN